MRIKLEEVRELRFAAGAPVRAASAIASFGDGWLIAQDDATHAAWQRPGGVVPVRVLPPVDGYDVFSAAAGTKHLKPDLEAACEVRRDTGAGVLLLGSGSTAARMRGSLVTVGPDGPRFAAADLTPVYTAVARALGLGIERLNLEGACRLGDRLRWFHRGGSGGDAPSASVDLDAAALLSVLDGGTSADTVTVSDPYRYELGSLDGVPLGVTDAVALPDGRVLLSAAAENTPNAVDDGPVAGAVLALLDGERLVDVGVLPESGAVRHKVEGLALVDCTPARVRLLGVVDADDPDLPSVQLTLRVDWA